MDITSSWTESRVFERIYQKFRLLFLFFFFHIFSFIYQKGIAYEFDSFIFTIIFQFIHRIKIDKYKNKFPYIFYLGKFYIALKKINLKIVLKTNPINNREYELLHHLYHLFISSLTPLHFFASVLILLSRAILDLFRLSSAKLAP